MTERHYKREKVRGTSWEKKGYDQARALGPVLVLEKLSSAGEKLFLLHTRTIVLSVCCWRLTNKLLLI